MSWKWPNNGSRMNREVHVRFWESPEVKVLRATRHSRRIKREADMSGRPPIASPWRQRGIRRDGPTAVLESCLLQTQYGGGLLPPIDCLPPDDFMPAENPPPPNTGKHPTKKKSKTTR